MPRKKGYKLSEKTKRKISKANSGKNHGFYGKTHTAEVRKRISKANKGRRSPMKGRKHTAEAKRKISENNKGKHDRVRGSEEHERIMAAIRRYHRCVTVNVRKGVVTFLRLHSDIVIEVKYVGCKIQKIYEQKNQHGYPRHVHHKVATYRVTIVRGKKRNLTWLLKRMELRRCKHGWNAGLKAFLEIVQG